MAYTTFTLAFDTLLPNESREPLKATIRPTVNIVRDADGNSVVAGPIELHLPGGTGSVVLVDPNSPDLEPGPGDWSYIVVHALPGGGSVTVPLDPADIAGVAGGTLHFADALTIDPATLNPLGQEYVAASDFDAAGDLMVGASGGGYERLPVGADGKILVAASGEPSGLGWGDAPAGGEEWLTGSGVPDSGLGSDGDFYLDSTTGDVYEKAVGAWSVVANIKGPQGDPGTDGSVWHSGAGAPASGLGQDGDFYLDTDSGDVHEKAAGAWSIVDNLTSPAGSDGTDGAQWHTSTGVPSDATGADGDYNLDTDSGDVYEKAAGTWGAAVGNIHGPGATVAVGTTTATDGETAAADVVNSGTASAAVLDFDFTLPAGAKGDTGPVGPIGNSVSAILEPSETYNLNPANATQYSLTMTGPATLTQSGLTGGAAMLVTVIQDGTGGHTLTIPSAWVGSAALVLTETANEFDTLVIWDVPDLGVCIKRVLTGPVPSGLWTPLQIASADRAFWHRADSLPLEAEDPVTSWDDEYGIDDYTTVEGSPTLKILNGIKYVAFDGTDDALLSGGPAAGTNTPVTVVMLARVDGAGQQNVLDDGNNLSGFELWADAADGPQNWRANSADPDTLTTNGQFQVVVAFLNNSASAWVRVDGTEQVLNTGGKGITTAGLILGRNQADTGHSAVSVVEEFAFAGEPDAQTLADLETYLGERRDTLNGV